MAKDVVKKPDIDFSFNDQDMMMIMMIVVMVAVMSQFMSPLAQAAQAQAQSLQSMQYEGRTDNREIDVPSGSIVYIDLIHNAPQTPWSWALFENDGPNNVEIGLNEPNDRFILSPGESKTVDRIAARERISIIFFYCEPTETAHVRITGEY